MKSVTLVAIILHFWLSGAAATAAPFERPDIVGKFDCVQRDGTGTVWRFRSVNRVWGAFVRADTVFAPQNGQPADYASTYAGFDASSKTWNIVSVDMDGSYFTRYSRSRSFNGAHWVDRYPADGHTAIVLTSRVGYTFILSGRVEKGRESTSKTVCTRSSF